MNTIRKISGRISHWYRQLFIEIPEGYGDPISPKVEKFQDEMKDKKEGEGGAPDGKEYSEGNRDNHRHKE
jgi:hypothetical protein